MLLTKEERAILLIIIISFFSGCLIYFFVSFQNKIRIENKTHGLININIATKEEIDKLPGIGEVLADRIIEYRKQKNGFKNINELKEIKGITAKKFEKIKKYIQTQ